MQHFHFRISLVKAFIILFFIFISVSEVYSQPSQVWLQRWNSQPTGDNCDRAEVIKRDLSGNIYVAGTAKGRNSVDWLTGDYVLIKYNSAGVQQWVKTYNGPTGARTDWIYAIDIDNSGNVYVTGRSDGTSGSNSNYEDICTIKYNSNGDSLWGRRYNGTGNSTDYGTDILVDNTGNVYVCGRAISSGGSGVNYIIIKYNTDGVTQWTALFDGPAGENDYGESIAFDNSGNIIITGYVDQNRKYGTVKYSSNGAIIWARYYDNIMYSGGYDEAYIVKTDINDNVYVTGMSQTAFYTNTRFYDYVTIKYDSSGFQQWILNYSASLSTPDSSMDIPTDLILDNSGNIYITGRSTYFHPGSSSDYCTIKYNNNGTFIWASRWASPAAAVDMPWALALDNLNNVYVTGQGNSNYVTVKYNTSGVFQWAAIYDNGSTDVARDIVVDNSGYSYVTGYSMGLCTDIVTIKYDNLTGVQVIGNEIPKEYKLHQNYPNPFNPTTNIRYDLPKNGFVKLVVFDALGREIETLVNEQLNAGTYEVDWNATNFPSGIYFYRLTAGDFSETKKMLLLK